MARKKSEKRSAHHRGSTRSGKTKAIVELIRSHFGLRLPVGLVDPQRPSAEPYDALLKFLDRLESQGTGNQSSSVLPATTGKRNGRP